MSKFLSIAPYLTLFTFAFIVIAGVVLGLGDSEFRSAISDVNTARGIITFIVAVMAASVILLMAVAIFYLDDNQLGRIDKAKELLTIVVGILGTIIGYYYGAAEKPDARSPNAPAKAEAFKIAQSVGEKGKILFSVSGDNAPYRLAISDHPNALAADGGADSGKFALEIGKITVCPTGLKLSVVGKDNKPLPDATISIKKDDLKVAGWTACAN